MSAAISELPLGPSSGGPGSFLETIATHGIPFEKTRIHSFFVLLKFFLLNL